MHYNGSSWTRFGPYASIPNVTFNSVTCANANDCWAVGNASSGEMMVHWDRSTWERFSPGALANVELFAVTMISPKSQPQCAWTENFN